MADVSTLDIDGDKLSKTKLNTSKEKPFLDTTKFLMDMIKNIKSSFTMDTRESIESSSTIFKEYTYYESYVDSIPLG